MNNTVLALALALTSLANAKQSNRPFREVWIWESACKRLAIRARRRILHFAMEGLRP